VKLNLKPLSWIVLGAGFVLYLMLAMNDSHTPSQAVDNFVKSSFILLLTLFIWTSMQVIMGLFKMRQFSWVLSITGYILSVSVFCYFGINQQTASLFSFNGVWALTACAIAMFSTLPLLILYYKDNQSVVGEQEAKAVETKQESTVDSKAIEDDNWEPASVEDLHSGEFELES